MALMELEKLIKKNYSLNVIFEHRTIRIFKIGKQIPSSHKQIIENAAQRAATSCSGQMYTFIEIKNENVRNSLYEICGKQSMIKDASLFYLVLADVYRLDKLVAKAGGKCQLGSISGALIAACDASFAAQNLVLAAESLGYGTAYIGTCGDKCEEVAQLLKLPKRVIPLYGLCVGVPAEYPPLRPRINTNLVFHIDTYHEPTDLQLSEAIRHMSAILEEEDYYQKYSNRKNYIWKDHLKGKFGGIWLKEVEKERKKAVDKTMSN